MRLIVVAAGVVVALLITGFVLFAGTWIWRTQSSGRRAAAEFAVWLELKASGDSPARFLVADDPEEWGAILASPTRAVEYWDTDWGQMEFMVTLAGGDRYRIGHLPTERSVWVKRLERRGPGGR